MTDTTPELWTTSRVADEYGVTPAGARSLLRDWAVAAVAREPGRGGQNLYPADDVRAAHAARPGRGHRTDLRAT